DGTASQEPTAAPPALRRSFVRLVIMGTCSSLGACFPAKGEEGFGDEDGGVVVDRLGGDEEAAGQEAAPAAGRVLLEVAGAGAEGGVAFRDDLQRQADVAEGGAHLFGGGPAAEQQQAGA